MSWIIENWHDLWPSPFVFAALALAAVVGGAMVGIERERKGKPVGVRTLVLVSLGSASFTMVSAGFGHAGGEALRIAPQVVSGIGFLGAGVILRGQFGITGLTSAATIWAVAAAGMVVGSGYGGAGLCLSAFILALLWILTAIEHRYVGPCQYCWVSFSYRAAGGKTLIRIEEVLDEYRVPATSRIQVASAPGGDALEHLRVTYCRAHPHHREFLTQLASFPEVEEILREEICPPEPAAS